MIRRYVWRVVVLAAILAVPFVQAEEWDDLSVQQVNVEKPHATMMTYPSEQLAMEAKRENSPWFKLLNSDWKFNWSVNPASRPADFYKVGFNDGPWRTIPVPSNWQAHGFGIPIYTNFKYPHPVVPPKAPRKFNPVGSYRTTFSVPASWKGRRTLISFGGVNSAFYLWINGKKVGYSQGSRTPAEFDITEYLKDGKNLLAAEVYRWCDSSYIEDQDFWRLAGIFRDVYLWSRADKHIRDFEVDVDLDASYKNGTLSVRVDAVKADNATVDLQLTDAGGTSVVKGTQPVANKAAAFTFSIPDVRTWNPESPYLYQLLLTLKDGDKVVEVIPWKVGFRKVEIKGQVFTVNGVPVKMKGVNRHETDPDTWHYIKPESALKDVKLFKEFNVNAVRTCHYPTDPLFYSLCDEYGIFVMDEANIECHAARGLSGKQEWVPAQMNRITRMAERDKNHTSIVIWSLGNESGRGIGPHTMYKWLKETHPDRPVHCEYDNSAADMVSRMYAPTQWGRNGAKPNVLCEYTHAMGNSNGNLKEYWHQTIYTHPGHMGGFVWDWVDQGLRQPVPAEFKDRIGVGPVAKTFFAYGGWWENAKKIYTDRNFCMNGLVAADRTPHPGLFAIKYAYRNVHVKAVDAAAGKFKVRNWFDYSRISDRVDGTWSLLANGRPIANGSIPALNVAPHTERAFSIKLPAIKKQRGVEYLLTLSFVAKEGYSPLVKKGHELAWEQFTIVEPSALPTQKPKGQQLKVSNKASALTVSGDGFSLSFNKQKGGLTSFTHKGKALIDRGFVPEFWRALTDNDRPSHKKFTDEGRWKDAGSTWQIEKATIKKVARNSVRVLFDATLPKVKGRAQLLYTVYVNGEVGVSMTYEPGSDTLKAPLRYGLEALLPADLNKVVYYGRGPHPTYSDRKFERLGIFETTVDNLWVDYSKPQENGYRTDTRWVALLDAEDKGLLFVGEPTIGFGARYYDTAVMRGADYSFQMERSKSIHLNIDLEQCGVGGNNSWGATPLGVYQLKNRKVSYAFRMIPVTSGDDIKQALKVRPSR